MAIQSSAIESSMMDGLDAGAVAVDDQEDLFDILTQLFDILTQSQLFDILTQLFDILTQSLFNPRH